MNRKAVLVVGIIAVVGIGYYLYSKSSKPTTEGNLGDGSGGNTLKSETSPNANLTRKDKRKLCGRKPLFNKAKRDAWQQCINQGGVASFDGDYGL